MLLNEIAAGFHFVSHQDRENLIHAGHVFQLDPQQDFP